MKKHCYEQVGNCNSGADPTDKAIVCLYIARLPPYMLIPASFVNLTASAWCIEYQSQSEKVYFRNAFGEIVYYVSA